MAFHTNYRRNESAEDKAIRARLALMDYLMDLHMNAGVSREEASRAAFDTASKLNRKQAERMLAEIKTY